MPTLVLRSLLSYMVMSLRTYCLTYGNVPVPAGCVAHGESALAKVLRAIAMVKVIVKSLTTSEGLLLIIYTDWGGEGRW